MLALLVLESHVFEARVLESQCWQIFPGGVAHRLPTHYQISAGHGSVQAAVLRALSLRGPESLWQLASHPVVHRQRSRFLEARKGSRFHKVRDWLTSSLGGIMQSPLSCDFNKALARRTCESVRTRLAGPD